MVIFKGGQRGHGPGPHTFGGLTTIGKGGGQLPHHIFGSKYVWVKIIVFGSKLSILVKIIIFGSKLSISD